MARAPTIHEKAVTLKQLRALAAILREGNLAAAAASLNVTGPAVSTQLRLLEANVGARLVERGPNGKVRPTPEGRELLAATAEIESALRLSFDKIRAIRAGNEGLVALGVVSTGKYFAPGLVARAREALPGIRVALKVGNRAELIAALAERAVELAITGRPPREPEVVAEPIGPHPHVIIAPPDHPLAGRDDISPDELLGQTFLMREPGSGSRLLAERFLEAIGGGRAWESVEIGTNETIKQAVMAGLGIAMISAHTVSAELAAGRLATIAFPGLPIVRTWYLVHRADTELAPAAARFRDFVLGLEGSFLPALPEGAAAARDQAPAASASSRRRTSPSRPLSA